MLKGNSDIFQLKSYLMMYHKYLVCEVAEYWFTGLLTDNRSYKYSYTVKEKIEKLLSQVNNLYLMLFLCSSYFQPVVHLQMLVAVYMNQAAQII